MQARASPLHCYLSLRQVENYSHLSTCRQPTNTTCSCCTPPGAMHRLLEQPAPCHTQRLGQPKSYKACATNKPFLAHWVRQGHGWAQARCTAVCDSHENAGAASSCGTMRALVPSSTQGKACRPTGGRTLAGQGGSCPPGIAPGPRSTAGWQPPWYPSHSGCR